MCNIKQGNPRVKDYMIKRIWLCTTIEMNKMELYVLVKEFYGYKAKMSHLNSKTKEVVCVLYDCFILKCSLDERYGSFGAGIVVGGKNDPIVTTFLGKGISLNSDEESVKKSLNIIDEYCRMRLPDKFLDAYDTAYNI